MADSNQEIVSTPADQTQANASAIKVENVELLKHKEDSVRSPSERFLISTKSEILHNKDVVGTGSTSDKITLPTARKRSNNGKGFGGTESPEMKRRKEPAILTAIENAKREINSGGDPAISSASYASIINPTAESDRVQAPKPRGSTPTKSINTRHSSSNEAAQLGGESSNPVKAPDNKQASAAALGYEHPILKLAMVLRRLERFGVIVSYFPERDAGYAKAFQDAAGFPPHLLNYGHDPTLSK